MRNAPGFAIAVGLAVLFTAALFFATFEVPGAVSGLLLSAFPDYCDIGEWMQATVVTQILRPFGYIAFAVTLILMAIGFAAKRRLLTTTGSLALVLPTFGYFAGTMFFLAGIGILRVLWLPMFDLWEGTLELGNIVFLPYFILGWLLSPAGTSATLAFSVLYHQSSYIVLVIGLGIFLFGALTWLYGRFKGVLIVDFWIYRYSRHPQYLGFLLWSYGLLNLVPFWPVVKGGYVPPATLPWLVSSLAIIGVALREESVMVRKFGEEYLAYRGRSSFMLPLPKQVSAVITAPVRAFFRKHLPENGKEIAFVLLFYGVLLVLLSLPLVTFF